MVYMHVLEPSWFKQATFPVWFKTQPFHTWEVSYKGRVLICTCSLSSAGLKWPYGDEHNLPALWASRSTLFSRWRTPLPPHVFQLPGNKPSVCMVGCVSGDRTWLAHL